MKSRIACLVFGFAKKLDQIAPEKPDKLDGGWEHDSDGAVRLGGTPPQPAVGRPII
jgi:hypothetical protein